MIAFRANLPAKKLAVISYITILFVWSLSIIIGSLLSGTIEISHLRSCRLLPPVGEPVSFNILILEPVTTKTSQTLTVSGCRNYVTFIVEQVLERLESTSLLPQIDKLDLECWDSQTSCEGTVLLTNSLEEHCNNSMLEKSEPQ